MRIRIALLVTLAICAFVTIFILACPKPTPEGADPSINRTVPNENLDPTESDNDADEGSTTDSHDNDGDEGG
jgi:hypothetical protein